MSFTARRLKTGKAVAVQQRPKISGLGRGLCSGEAFERLSAPKATCSLPAFFERAAATRASDDLVLFNLDSKSENVLLFLRQENARFFDLERGLQIFRVSQEQRTSPKAWKARFGLINSSSRRAINLSGQTAFAPDLRIWLFQSNSVLGVGARDKTGLGFESCCAAQAVYQRPDCSTAIK